MSSYIVIHRKTYSVNSKPVGYRLLNLDTYEEEYYKADVVKEMLRNGVDIKNVIITEDGKVRNVRAKYRLGCFGTIDMKKYLGKPENQEYNNIRYFRELPEQTLFLLYNKEEKWGEWYTPEEFMEEARQLEIKGERISNVDFVYGEEDPQIARMDKIITKDITDIVHTKIFLDVAMAEYLLEPMKKGLIIPLKIEEVYGYFGNLDCQTFDEINSLEFMYGGNQRPYRYIVPIKDEEGKYYLHRLVELADDMLVEAGYSRYGMRTSDDMLYYKAFIGNNKQQEELTWINEQYLLIYKKKFNEYNGNKELTKQYMEQIDKNFEISKETKMEIKELTKRKG